MTKAGSICGRWIGAAILLVLRARRVESGRVFTLRVDRCSGEIVDARPHHLRAFGAYAPRFRGHAYRY